MKWIFYIFVFNFIHLSMQSDSVTGDCTFDTDLCGWRNGGPGFNNWTRINGPTANNNTGPTSDHTSGTGYYIVANTYMRSFARLSSPLFNYTTHRCITFWYHMGLSGNLKILVEREHDSFSKTVWTLSGDQGYNWQQGRASIPDVSSNITIVFEDSSYFGDIAIDDIKFVTVQNCTTQPDNATATSTESQTSSIGTTLEEVNTTSDRPTTFHMTSYPSEKGYCPAELYDNINWWTTTYGETDIRRCPSGYTGNSSRTCFLNGKWDNPVYINCVDKTLVESSEKLQKLENIGDSEKVSKAISEVLDSVGNFTETGDHDKDPIKSGDLQKMTDILSQIIRIGNSRNATVKSEKVVDVINAILNSGNNESWTEVNEKGQSGGGSADIMKIVEDLGSLVKKGLNKNESKTIKRANLEIEISEMKQELTFPQNSKSLIIEDQQVISGKFYTVALYKTMSSILPTAPNSSIGSDVIALSFDQTITLEKNITITFERNKQVDFQNPEVSCGYWNFTNNSWSYSGCYLKQDNAQYSTCTCNHLTNFAILMSPSDVELSDVHQKALEVITFVGCGLSLLGCVLTLVIYCIMWRYVKNEWAVILVNICVILIIGYSVFIGAVDQTENDIACNIITAILHYSFLVVFFLMLTEGISVATTVTVVFKKKKSRLPIYLTLAWVIPILIVGITMGVTRLKGYHSDKYCWLHTDNFVFLAFVVPALVIIVINIGALCFVLRAIYSTVAMANKKIEEKARAGVKCMVTLLPVLGLSWLFGVLAFSEETIVFQYLFGITTSCQGLCIFIFHTVLNKKVQEGFRKILYKRRLRAKSHVSTKQSSSASNKKSESKVNSTDTTNLRDLKNDSSPKVEKVSSESPKFREMKSYLKINRSGLYQLTKS